MLGARTKEVVASPSWPTSSFDAVSELVKLDSMTLTECQLFEALLVWGRANCREDGGLRKLLQPLLSQVRFMCMEQTEFAQQLVYLGNDEVLTPQEKLQIMLCLALGEDAHIPPGFSKSNINRNQNIGYRHRYGY